MARPGNHRLGCVGFRGHAATNPGFPGVGFVVGMDETLARARRLAEAEASDVLIMWGRLGYPRRALRLHETAKAVVTAHNGVLPADPELLLQLPGIGEYTAAAVSSFAFGIPEVVIDTNIRRVHARIFSGKGAGAPNL